MNESDVPLLLMVPVGVYRGLEDRAATNKRSIGLETIKVLIREHREWEAIYEARDALFGKSKEASA